MLLNVPEMERVVRKWTVCDVVQTMIHADVLAARVSDEAIRITADLGHIVEGQPLSGWTMCC
jgi:hypothetical protein